ncbi:uncharacterized protein LOC143238935 [Tachypleus tridentatus]|uniref:uncharacterized protein LOC143238935 n=1 Tax=Tachypleus tridentatus TaxID=6853 RepID=UPI003FCEF518
MTRDAGSPKKGHLAVILVFLLSFSHVNGIVPVSDIFNPATLLTANYAVQLLKSIGNHYKNHLIPGGVLLVLNHILNRRRRDFNRSKGLVQYIIRRRNQESRINSDMLVH